MARINQAIKEKLDYLSNLPETDYPFITVYLNIHSHEDYFGQNRTNNISLKDFFHKSGDQIKEHDRREKHASFQIDEKKIKDYLDNQLNTQAHGVAFFACSRLGVFEAFQSLMPFENSFVIDSFPHLKQLAYQADEYENALVVLIDAKYSRIFNVKLGGFLINELDTESMLHRFHKEGGWAQSNYQRHIEKQVDSHYKETADIVSEFMDKEHYDNVILIGQEHEVKNFQINLPKRVNIKVIDINSLQMRENINDILQTIINDLRKSEKQKELDTVVDIINKAQGGGFETLGIQDTVRLAKDGRVSVLAVVRDQVYNGWKCGDCYYISRDQHYGTCPECNGNTKQTDLIEEAIRLTLKNGGKVDLVEDEAAVELQKHEGIGAYLRY